MLSRQVYYLRAWGGAMMSLAFVVPRSAEAQAYPPPDDPPPMRATASPPPPPVVVPPGYHLERHVRPWLPITGGVLLGLLYGVALNGGVQSRCAQDRWLILPVFGPFAAAHGDHSASTAAGCDDAEGLKPLVYFVDGLGQFVGAGLLLSALTFTRSEIVPDKVPGLPPERPLMSWRVVPTVGVTERGVSVQGTF